MSDYNPNISMDRGVRELKDQIVRDATEISSLQSELTAAKAEIEAVRLANLDCVAHYEDARAEIERLRGREAEMVQLFAEGFDSDDGHDLEAWERRAKAVIADRQSDAWLRRKQAEAVEEVQNIITMADSTYGMQQAARNYAQRLREQATELENGHEPTQ